MIKKRLQARGFTLIELLVVIAIIAILASIILASLNQARSKSRDARRVADLKQVQLALELYNNDNGGYPVQGTYGNLVQASGAGAALVAGNYISVIPTDPGSYAYKYASLTGSGASAALCSAAPCNSYVLIAQIENATPASTFASSYQGTAYSGGQTGCGTAAAGGYYCVRP